MEREGVEVGIRNVQRVGAAIIRDGVVASRVARDRRSGCTVVAQVEGARSRELPEPVIVAVRRERLAIQLEGELRANRVIGPQLHEERGLIDLREDVA